MVLAGTKRCLRTGNTLRNVGRRTKTGKRPQGVIVRHSAHLGPAQPAGEADDSLLTADDVEFSLNKKGRWNLPDVIEANLMNEDLGAAKRVSLLRRVRLNRQNDCLSAVMATEAEGQRNVYSTNQRKKARRKTYCNGLNVLHNGRGKTTKDKKKKQVVSSKHELAKRESQAAPEVEDAAAEEEASPTPEVRYDVICPVPKDSSLHLNPKLTGIEQSLVAYGNLKRGTNRRSKHVDYDDGYGWGEDYFSYSDDDDDDDSGVCDSYDETEQNQNSDFETDRCHATTALESALQLALLNSFTPAPARTSDRKKRRGAHAKRRSRGRYWYQTEVAEAADSCLGDSEEEDTSSEGDSPPAPAPAPFPLPQNRGPSRHRRPVTVTLPTHVTDGCALRARYGSGYWEAACWPRRVVLDVSGRLKDRIRASGAAWDLPFLDLTTYVILTHAGPDHAPSVTSPGQQGQGSLTPERDTFSLQLNMNSAEPDLDLDIPEARLVLGDVDQAVDFFLDHIHRLSPGCLARGQKDAWPFPQRSRLQPDFQTTARVNGWTTAFVSLSEVVAAECSSPAASGNTLSDVVASGHEVSIDPMPAAQGDQDPASRLQKTMVEDASLTQAYCGVCLDDLFPGRGLDPPATALRQCGHWFCHSCWASHLLVTTQGARAPVCPEFRCRAEVDHGTLVSLLRVRDVMLLRRRLAESKMTRMSVSRWCPDPHCGRLVQVTSQRPSQTDASGLQAVTAACPCGRRFCVRCAGDPHWPLTCRHARRYLQLLRDSGDLDAPPDSEVADVVVRGKFCSACHAFIQKDGGCPYMICVCGHNFYWCCGKNVKDGHHPDCHQESSWALDRQGTVARRVRHVKVPRPDMCAWYQLALQHRGRQHAKERRRMRHVERALREELLRLLSKGVDIGLEEVGAGVKLTETEMASSGVKDGGVKDVGVKDTGGFRQRMQQASLRQAAASERVKRALERVLRLKAEVHNAIQHAAALVHLAQGPEGAGQGHMTPGRVKVAVERLAFVSESLDLLLRCPTPRDARCLLPRFSRLQPDISTALKDLARAVGQ